MSIVIIMNWEEDAGGQNEFQQKYRCLHCGAIGIVTQIWVKGHDEYEV